MSATSIKAYYGFARKSGSVLYGVDKVCEAKRLYLVFASELLAPNSKKKLERKCQNMCVPFIELSELDFMIIEPNPSVKCVGIKNAELAKAMQKE